MSISVKKKISPILKTKTFAEQNFSRVIIERFLDLSQESQEVPAFFWTISYLKSLGWSELIQRLHNSSWSTKSSDFIYFALVHKMKMRVRNPSIILFAEWFVICLRFLLLCNASEIRSGETWVCLPCCCRKPLTHARSKIRLWT